MTYCHGVYTFCPVLSRLDSMLAPGFMNSVYCVSYANCFVSTPPNERNISDKPKQKTKLYAIVHCLVGPLPLML